jgi:2Fe-2S ferredoxin
MPKITLRPLDVVLETLAGETIMGAAQKQGYYWPTTCGGEGRCTTCACVILQGLEKLSERGRFEAKVLTEERGSSVLQSPIRLACQAHVYGDVVVEKTGVRRPSESRLTAGPSNDAEE